MATTMKQSAGAALLLAACLVLWAAQETTSATEATSRPVLVDVVVEPVSAAPEGSPALTALVTVTGLPPGSRGTITVDFYGPIGELSDTSCSPDRLVGRQELALDILEVLGPDTAVAQGSTQPWHPPAPGVYAAQATFTGDTGVSGDPLTQRLSGLSPCPAPDASVLVTEYRE